MISMQNYLDKKYKIPFKILNNSLKKGKVSHAYLFSGNKRSLKLDMAKYFVKMIYCEAKKNDIPCEQCYHCNIINSNSFSEMKIIDPEGLHIKKEDILDLQVEFSRKSIDGENRIYIINNAERLNKSASNSLLKFLEEPAPGVIAILICNNTHELLPTIISRCQNIIFTDKIDNAMTDMKEKQNYYISTVLNSTEEGIREYIENSADDELESIFNYIALLEKDNIDAFIYKKTKFMDIFKTKEEFEKAIKLITLFYVDVINSYHTSSVDLYFNEFKRIEEIISTNKIEEITDKIKILIDIEEVVKYNSNLNLLLDKLVFLFKEVKND